MKAKQIFLTNRGEPLARWVEAFSGAVVAKPGSGKNGDRQALVWLHLDQDGADVAAQVMDAVAFARGAPVVVMSNTPNQPEGLACLEAGAVGYVSALAVPEMLHQVVNVVENGGLWVGPELLTRLRTALAERPDHDAATDERLSALSKREKEVAVAVASGASNKEIAREMGITERTVKAHLSAIFDRLRIRDRLQLALLVKRDQLHLKETVH